MIEGSFVREHGVMMLSLVNKLKDLYVDLDIEDTYIDAILHYLPPSFDKFIVNYNMNRLDTILQKVINMLLQYEATIKNSTSSVLVEEASTFKVKGKDVKHSKRKKVETASTVARTSSAPVTPLY
ncbi:UNVERIFIED_CONTAM: hypothetical protein Sangu_2835600 [Sesamum angustifolium]|uniref:UBN2 domain-containing protein n=1 Tax=Sesamum angustifolium TaxID=2727405 RepID=A0AAW2IR29_9LAMI